MSAYLSCISSNVVNLLTDGAVYDIARGYVLVDIKCKVRTARSAPFVVTSRGASALADKVDNYLCSKADEWGVDELLRLLPEVLPEFKANPALEGRDDIEVLIAAWSDSRGPCHFHFHNSCNGIVMRRPLQLWEPPKVWVGGPIVNVAELSAAGVRSKRPGEDDAEYLRDVGADLFETMRRTPSVARGNGDKVRNTYLVGGHVDLTTVTRDGVSVMRLRTWNDRIGEPINPFAGHGNVTPIGLNRQQRRAAEREVRRRA